MPSNTYNIICFTVNYLDYIQSAIGSCDFSKGEINAVMKEMATQSGVPYSKLMQFCRTVVTGTQVCMCACVCACMHVELCMYVCDQQ